MMTALKALSSLTSLLILSITATQAAETVWDDSFDGRARVPNSNLHEYVKGAGAVVTQGGGNLVLNTNTSAGSAQAAVNTRTDKTGEFNGVGAEFMYNYHAHPVQVHFEIDSIQGKNGKGGNVFYCSIGEDSDGNYVPQRRGLDHGVGFSLDQLAEHSIWRLSYGSYRDGKGKAKSVALLSAMPTALSFTFTKDMIHIEMAGATVKREGSAGTATPGDTKVSVSIEDLSSVISDYTLAFGAYNHGLVTSETVVKLNRFRVKVGE